MYAVTEREARRGKIHKRIRSRLTGTAERPRLSVYRSLKHIYVQAVDDEQGRTIASASSTDTEYRAGAKGGGNVAAAKAVGALIATRLKGLGVETAVFDRSGYLYHGRIKALADAAREGGLAF